jgi:YD repeat-containing protein
MKYCALAVLSAGAALAQSQNQTTYTYDVNGRRTAVSSTATSKTNGQMTSKSTVPSINTGAVPTVGVNQRVVSQGPGSQVVERIVQKYDQNGRKAGTEKIRVEEQKAADGSVVTRTTVYDSDLNGGYTPRQRSVAQTTVSGNVARTETVIERPSLNGGFDLSEKQLAVTKGDDRNSQKDVTVYRKDSNGRFMESAREITQVQTQNGRQVTTTAEYNAASTGKMQLAGQKVSTMARQPDGREIEVTDVYGHTATAQYGASNTKPQLREQQVIEKKPGPGGSLIETFSVRRPALDTNRLGPLTKISETVCTGNCVPPPAAAPAAGPAAAPAQQQAAAQPAAPPQP